MLLAQGQAPSDKPASEPYWGNPAVRNLRGDDGNVGIIRSPVRAIALPDPPGGAYEPIFQSRCTKKLYRAWRTHSFGMCDTITYLFS